jgi:peptidylprolyl isomerase
MRRNSAAELFRWSSPQDRITPMKMLTRLALFVAAMAFCGSAMAATADAENDIYLDLAFGRVVITLEPTVAPHTVEQIKKLVRDGFYNGIVFHRVIDGFMAQTGDPTGTGGGGSGHPLHAEFSKEPFVRGVVAMARTSDPNSADSQFFIMYDAAPALDGKYTIFGHVKSGMEYVDKLKKGDPANNGKVTNPDKIIKMQIALDAILAEQKANTPKMYQDPDTSKPGPMGNMGRH